MNPDLYIMPSETGNTYYIASYRNQCVRYDGVQKQMVSELVPLEEVFYTINGKGIRNKFTSREKAQEAIDRCYEEQEVMKNKEKWGYK